MRQQREAPVGGSPFASHRPLCGCATSRVWRTCLLSAVRSYFRWGAGADQQHRGHEELCGRHGHHVAWDRTRQFMKLGDAPRGRAWTPPSWATSTLAENSPKRMSGWDGTPKLAHLCAQGVHTQLYTNPKISARLHQIGKSLNVEDLKSSSSVEVIITNTTEQPSAQLLPLQVARTSTWPCPTK